MELNYLVENLQSLLIKYSSSKTQIEENLYELFSSLEDKKSSNKIENLSEFVLLAASLFELKAKRMLPQDTDVEWIEEVQVLKDKDLAFARLLQFKAFSAPGHTNDQLSYFCDTTEKPILFSGDTLFYAGCGRLFEGTPEDMLFSMDRYKELPSSTLIYCGHEYTESNLKFAMAVEPDNQDILESIKQVQEARSMNKPSLPSQIDTEFKINPFMRCRELSVIEAAENYSKRKLNSTAEVLGEIRNWKDNF